MKNDAGSQSDGSYSKWWEYIKKMLEVKVIGVDKKHAESQSDGSYSK